MIKIAEGRRKCQLQKRWTIISDENLRFQKPAWENNAFLELWTKFWWWRSCFSWEHENRQENLYGYKTPHFTTKVEEKGKENGRTGAESPEKRDQKDADFEITKSQSHNRVYKIGYRHFHFSWCFEIPRGNFVSCLNCYQGWGFQNITRNEIPGTQFFIESAISETADVFGGKIFKWKRKVSVHGQKIKQWAEGVWKVEFIVWNIIWPR